MGYSGKIFKVKESTISRNPHFLLFFTLSKFRNVEKMKSSFSSTVNP